MKKTNQLFGIDANEANLVQCRVGSNQFAYGLLKAINKSDFSHKYVIYTSTGLLPDMPKERGKWEYRTIPPPKFWTQWRLPLDLYLHKPQPNVFLSLSHYVPRFSPVPRVVTITDLGYLKFPEQLRKRDLLQLKFWTAHSIKVANHIIAISEFTKKDIIDNYDISHSKISVVYPAYDKEAFKPAVNRRQTKKILRRYSINEPYLLFLGALKPSKNLERLVGAFGLLKDENLKLVIAGKKGWLYQTIFRKVKHLKLQEKVIFTDFVLDNEIPHLMSGAEVFVCPSLYEGFGMPVVESMACGVPVVVSNKGSLLEVVGDAGVVVDPHDIDNIAAGIKKARKDRHILVKRGLIRAKRFNWNNSATEIIKILKSYS